MRASRPSVRRGFSLVELMFAIAIGLFVVSALYNLFTSQVKAFVYQDIQMEMHQSSRLALDIMSRTARTAGLGTNGTTTGIFGAGGDADSALPAIISYNGAGPNGSDAVTFVAMDASVAMTTWDDTPPACGTDELHFQADLMDNATSLAQYRSGELVMCYDVAAETLRSWMWELAADGDPTGTLRVNSNTGYLDFDDDCSSSNNLPMVMKCARADVVTFYIDADESDGIGPGSAEHPVLMMDMDLDAPSANDVPLVDNVEDLQVRYCLDDLDDTTLESCDDTSSSWVNSITASQAADVYMVRIEIVQRSSREDPRRLYTGQRPALADNPASSTTDHYFRLPSGTEATVRNFKMLRVL
jgi:prepilin-type N-terminal cleavage/methylation domain-containing protein